MTNNDEILQYKTIQKFFQDINDKYNLSLPTDFSGSGPVSTLLQRPIAVARGEEPVLYEARGEPFDFVRLSIENPQLETTVIITVTQAGN